MALGELASLRQFALQQGWNPATAHRLKVAGQLVMVTDAVGRDMVHVARSLERIAESSDPQKGYMKEVNARQRAQHRPGAAPVPPTPAPAPIPPEVAVAAVAGAPEPILPSDTGAPEQPSRSATYNQARTAREVYQAKLSQIEYEQQVGRLVNSDKVRAEFAKQIISVRDQFLRLPDRLAPMLVGLDDIETIKRAIMVEVRTALTQFEVA